MSQRVVKRIRTSLLTILGTFIMMLFLSKILTLVPIIIIPLVLGLSRIIARKKVYFKSQQVELGLLNSHIEENITNINVVKSFNYEESSIRKFNNINNNLLEVSLKAQVYSSLLMPMMNFISNMGFALISLIGAILSVQKIIIVGVIATFLIHFRALLLDVREFLRY